jgi:2-amino-4-hydroxy-6-hydroxymethyldihydropteridine diphosphokinase
MPQVFVAAGSNCAPGRHLRCALAQLQRRFGAVRASPRYRNAAADGARGEFVNLVAGFETALTATEVHGRLKMIERHCGRSPAGAAGHIELDLDLLLYGELVCAADGLQLPRPELLRRAYMLGPLADLAPELMHPTAGLTIGELWQRFDRARHPLERLPG